MLAIYLLKSKKIYSSANNHNTSDSTKGYNNLKSNIHFYTTVEVNTSEEKSLEKENTDNYNNNYWIPVESKSRIVNAKLNLKYQNTRNIMSERAFDVSSFSRGIEGYHIHGYCYKKNRDITLSSLGILETIERESGKVVENIINYLEDIYKNSPEYKKDLLFDDYGWAIYSLVYLSATSGSIIKKERDIILKFTKSIPGFENLDEAWIDKTIRELYRPGKMEMRNWVKKAFEEGKDFSILKEPIDKLSECQKEENKEFLSFRKYIEKQTAAKILKET